MATKTKRPPDLKGIPCSDNQWKKLSKEGVDDIFTLVKLLRKRNKPSWMSGKFISELKAFIKSKEQANKKFTEDLAKKNGKKKAPAEKKPIKAKAERITVPKQSFDVVSMTTNRMINMTEELRDLYDALAVESDKDGVTPQSLAAILESFEIEIRATFNEVIPLIVMAEAEEKYWANEKKPKEKKRKRWDILAKGLRAAAKKFMILNGEKRIELDSGHEPNITDGKGDLVDTQSFDWSKVPKNLYDTVLFKEIEPYVLPAWNGLEPDWNEIAKYLVKKGNKSWCSLRVPETTRVFKIN